MKQNKKTILMLVSVVVLLAAVVGTTIAYLVASTTPITNTFTPTSVPIDIPEKIENNVKKRVAVTNKGDISAYVRVAVIVTWKDSNGNISATVPKFGKDYTWNNDTTKKWLKHTDGFYYYTEPLAAKKTTVPLFTECEVLVTQAEDKPGPDYNLSVEIIASSIQAEPEDAIKDAWGVTIKNGGVATVTTSD